MSMKLTAMWLWRTRACPGPGSPTEASSRRRTSGPPIWWMRMAWAMVSPGRAASGADRVGHRELLDEFMGRRPGAVTGGRIQVPDLAQVDQQAAPVLRELAGAGERG